MFSVGVFPSTLKVKCYDADTKWSNKLAQAVGIFESFAEFLSFSSVVPS